MFKYLWIIVVGGIFVGAVLYTAYLAYKYTIDNDGFDFEDFSDELLANHEPLASFWFILCIILIFFILILCVASACAFFKGE